MISFIVESVGSLGYMGIFLMMFLESSFFPFPSEVVMIPAGYLAYKGEMNAWIAIACGILGSLSGAVFNYYIALKMGRGFILHYGKYVFFSPQSLKKMEDFFEKHGHISTFVGRLIPAVRQYISLPAGLCKMNLWKFCIFSALGAGIWVAILTYIGFSLGAYFEDGEILQAFLGEGKQQNLALIKEKIKTYSFYIFSFLIMVIITYLAYRRKQNKL